MYSVSSGPGALRFREYNINPAGTAVPFCGQITYNSTGFSQKRDCGSKKAKSFQLLVPSGLASMYSVTSAPRTLGTEFSKLD